MDIENSERTHKLVYAISLIVYLVAGLLPAFVGLMIDYSGFASLASGWLSVFVIQSKPFWLVAWSANLFYFAGLFLGYRRTLSRKNELICSALAAVTSLFVFTIDTMFPNENSAAVPVEKGPAVYLWVLAIMILLAGNLFSYLGDKFKKKTTQ